jgi:hypothetical protein
MKKSLIVWCLIILLVSPGLSLRARALKTKFLATESSLGKLYPEIVEYSMVTSPDGQHFAYVARGQNEKFVVVDGVAGKHYEDIPGATLTEAGRPPEIKFSPDSRRVAHVAKRAGKTFLVVDGVEGKPYDNINAGSFVFSSDNKHVAYVAQNGDKQLVVVDGAEGKAYDEVRDLRFSKYGRRVVYLAKRSDKWIVVAEGAESGEYDGLVGALDYDGQDTLNFLAVRSGQYLRVRLDIAEE